MTRKRPILTDTLDEFARHLAANFPRESLFFAHNPEVAESGREYVFQQLYRLTFKDEFEYLLLKFRAQLGPAPLADFDVVAASRFTPRDDAVFATLLADKLAITPDGAHIPGKIGVTQIGGRVVGKRVNRRGAVKESVWPIYAGEAEERAADSGVADALPGPGAIIPDLQVMGG